MTGIPHHLAGSPYLRVVASLAWLILIINPVLMYGTPLPMMHGAHSSILPAAYTAQTTDHCYHAAPAKVDYSCCSGHDSGGINMTNHTCSTTTACCSALPAMSMAGVPAAPTPAIHWAPSRTDLRSINRAPPLRPPCV